jgi:SAM-dependent methyltransferase
MVPENVYGHAKRLKWIESHISKHSQIVELGCGTGYMITLPLAKMGFSIKGLDFDRASIDYGKNIFKEEGLDDALLIHQDIASLEEKPDVIIASEVFEHLTDEDFSRALKTVHAQLPAGGFLLVTVPNGYGWFEFESFLWNQLRLGWLLKNSGIVNITEGYHPSSSPILNFQFTACPEIHPFKNGNFSESNYIYLELRDHGFEIIQSVGSTLFSGQFSNLLFHGVKSFLKFNNYLGTCFPRLASGFYISCRATRNYCP